VLTHINQDKEVPMSVDVVAVDLDPIRWAVYCELCSSYVSEPTEHEWLADALYESHCDFHGLAADYLE